MEAVLHGGQSRQQTLFPSPFPLSSVTTALYPNQLSVLNRVQSASTFNVHGNHLENLLNQIPRPQPSDILIQQD